MLKWTWVGFDCSSFDAQFSFDMFKFMRLSTIFSFYNWCSSLATMYIVVIIHEYAILVGLMCLRTSFTYVFYAIKTMWWSFFSNFVRLNAPKIIFICQIKSFTRSIKSMRKFSIKSIWIIGSLLAHVQEFFP